MITYKTEVKVYIDGKHVGTIREYKGLGGHIPYQYFPKGSKTGGAPYATIELCKKSLEG